LAEIRNTEKNIPNQIKSNQIKSNQIFFCSRRCKIAQYKEPIQSLEQGHKGL